MLMYSLVLHPPVIIPWLLPSTSKLIQYTVCIFINKANSVVVPYSTEMYGLVAANQQSRLTCHVQCLFLGRLM